jgi:hypothetical protein
MRGQLALGAILTIGFALAGLGLAGCGRGGEEPTAAAPPATTQTVNGNVQQVTLTADAAQKLGIKTQPASAPAPYTTGKAAVPLAAVIYDPDGASWTYANPQPLTYVRQSITIDHIDGSQAVLREGPAPGTAVVIVGAPELLGIEYGVGEE